MKVRLVLHPRRTKAGYRYDVEHAGVMIVVRGRDPEHEAARALLAIGITGVAETVDAKSGAPRMRFDIEAFAATRTVERDRGGLSVEPWRPRPPEISHRGPQKRDSARRASVEPDEAKPQARPLRGNKEGSPDLTAPKSPAQTEHGE